MSGIRGLKRCQCDTNMVWGVSAFPVTGGWDGSGQDIVRTGLVKVRPKVSPYGAEYAGVAQGDMPAWYSGTVKQFHYDITDGNPSDGNSWREKKPLICSRAYYVDGKQAGVNYLAAGGAHGTNLGLGLSWWFQYDFESGVVQPIFLGTWNNDDDFEKQGGRYPHPYTFSCGHDEMYPYDNSYFYKVPRPRAHYVGQRFYIFNGHATSDYGAVGGNEWVLCRFDAQNANAATNDDNWYVPAYPDVGFSAPESPPTAGGFEDIPFYIQRPSFRCYIDTKAEQPDEPWCIAFDYATETYGVGRWLDDPAHPNQGNSLRYRIERTLFANTVTKGLGRYPNCVCYQHMQGRDIAIFRESFDYIGGVRGTRHWIFDGSALTELTGEAPTFITLDSDGNLLYGSHNFVRKTGAHGWVINSTSNTSPFPVPGTQPYWEVLGTDPPDGWESPTADYPQEFRERSEEFQILTNSKWIQLRGFRGDATLATAAVDIKPGFRMATPDNSRARRCNSGSRCPIPGWSLSYDGQLRIPHIQAQASQFGLTNGAGLPTETDTLRRIHARTYVDRDTSEWAVGHGADPALSAWPKYEDPFFSLLAENGIWEYLPQYDFMDAFGSGPSTYQRLMRDAFLSATNYHDFDIVGDCPCGCPATPVAY